MERYMEMIRKKSDAALRSVGANFIREKGAVDQSSKDQKTCSCSSMLQR